MSWAGKIVRVDGDTIIVVREPGEPQERFHCQNDPPVPLEGLIGGMIEAGTASGPLQWNGHTVGRRIGIGAFILFTKE